MPDIAWSMAHQRGWGLGEGEKGGAAVSVYFRQSAMKT